MQNLSKTVFMIMLVAGTFAQAHVGSPDVYYRGDAGPYHLFVTVRVPRTIPGAGEIEVRSSSSDVQSVQAAILHLTGPGSTLPPTPNIAQSSKGDPQLFTANLWFVEFGALQVRIEVNGSKGRAELSVPVASFARQSPAMNRGARAAFVLSFIFLALSVVAIFGALVRESTVAPSAVPSPSNRRHARIVMVTVLVAAVVVVLLIRTWWVAEAATYDRTVNLLKPPLIETVLLNGNRLVIRPSGRFVFPRRSGKDREITMRELIPDHGYLMHLFLVAAPGMQRMWHLHPDRADGDSFVVKLPEMPPGQYQVFADVLDKTGFPWTLMGNTALPQINGLATAGDDSAWAGVPLGGFSSDTPEVRLADGTRMVWERGELPVKANVPASLNFRVESKDGAPVRDLEPYMGMEAHAEIISSDLSVFAHIHPAGTVAMAALALAQRGDMVRSPSNTPHEMMMTMPPASSALPPHFSFAYGFPHPGDYRLFVQIKRSGQVQTAAFDTHVQ